MAARDHTVMHAEERLGAVRWLPRRSEPVLNLVHHRFEASGDGGQRKTVSRHLREGHSVELVSLEHSIDF
jgi:hypothetical protein